MKHREYVDKLRQDPEYVAAERELRPALDLADDILALRLSKGWSQAELARRMGTRQANISRVENGLANPTMQFLQKIASALDAELTIRLRGPDAARYFPDYDVSAKPSTVPGEHLAGVPSDQSWFDISSLRTRDEMVSS